MRRTIHKLFFAWDFEKEEKWLNEMASKGFQLISVGLCSYTFEDADKENYTYRIELLENLPSNYESTSYIKFLEDTGVEHIGSILRWVYFRKKTSDGPFDLYSDLESRIKHYKRIMYLLLAVTPLNLSNSISNLSKYPVQGSTVRLGLGVLCAALTALLGFGTLVLYKKIARLRKEMLIRE